MNAPKANPPSIDRTAFGCPHCGAYSAQTWFRLYAAKCTDRETPALARHEHINRIRSNEKLNEKTRELLLKGALDELPLITPYFGLLQKPSTDAAVSNIHLSSCFACKKVAIWVHDTIVSPFDKSGPPHHSDMPADIARDYDEARTILKMSPRGAAALLRLCIQKLCDGLGQKGKKIDDAIAALVAEGLPPIVSAALDSVRVIGNESVHPGKMDLRDDQATALKLFGLVNMIVERMISHPKQVLAVYELLPPEKRDAIDKRNAKALGQKKEYAPAHWKDDVPSSGRK
jgi:hypothetical protein